MKKIFIFILFILSLFASPASLHAQEEALSPEPITTFEIANIQPDKHYRALVVDILEEGINTKFEISSPYQKVRLKVINGDLANRQIIISHGADYNMLEKQKVKEGDRVVLVESHGLKTSYHIAEPYRLDNVLFIFIIFLIIVFWLLRWRGMASLLGLCFGICILIYFVVPQILAGHNPLIISFIGSFVIAAVSIYLAHGFHKRTTLAFISTLLTIIIALFLAVFFVSITHLFGMGTEEAFALQLGFNNINLKGLLLGGIVIGALGILDDVTTTQTAVVEEIHKANSKLSMKDLYHRGFSVGREHMTSMINTLALAYIGASFPMFLLFYTSETVPVWVILNSELIVEEIVRTLAGSIALLLAVPIATFLAAYSFSKTRNNI